MIRREFLKNGILAAAAALPANALFDRAASAAVPPCESAAFPESPGLTKYVSDFIINTKYENIPANVIELGRKTILDGFGLALAGSVSVSGPIIRRYLDTIGLAPGKASVIGTKMKLSPRFAALANGIAIHADDYDDTGSALHVNATALPPTFALCEVQNRSRKGFSAGLSRGH